MIEDIRSEKHARHGKGSAEDDTFLGPWAGFKQDDIVRGELEDFVEVEVFDKDKLDVEAPAQESSILHGQDTRDYLGRGYVELLAYSFDRNTLHTIIIFIGYVLIVDTCIHHKMLG